ncbi:MAG: hypothetical protein Q9159_005031 [Coniocarpon cinnabarinum]
MRNTGTHEATEDVCILCNDWPYGVDPKIVHLVCWTKFTFEEDSQTGDLTPRARDSIDDFVTERFRKHEDPARVLWFKNWSVSVTRGWSHVSFGLRVPAGDVVSTDDSKQALKSVHAVEHFHVMLHDPDPGFVRNITNGDVPLHQCVP